MEKGKEAWEERNCFKTRPMKLVTHLPDILAGYKTQEINLELKELKYYYDMLKTFL